MWPGDSLGTSPERNAAAMKLFVPSWPASTAPETPHSAPALRGSALPVQNHCSLVLVVSKNSRFASNLAHASKFPASLAGGWGRHRAVVVESISESEALLRADRDRCSGWQRRAVVCSRRSPRGPLVLLEAPQPLQSRPAPAEQQPLGSLQTSGAVFLLRRWETPQSGTGSTTRPCTQNPSVPSTLPGGASAATGAPRRELPACADTVTRSQKDEVGTWGDLGAFGYLGTLFLLLSHPLYHS